MQINFNINVLRDLVNGHPNDTTSLTKRFPQVYEWKDDTKKPTLNQLTELANYFNIPFGYFFLNKIPIKEYPIPHYRTTKRGKFEASPELLDMIEILEERQNWAKELITELREDPLEFANSLTVETEIMLAVEKIREVLDVHESWARNEFFKDWNEAFKFLASKAENAGIFVVINGVVGNNTQRKLSVNEFRGFVLYDEFAPFIFINNNDFVTGKIFTIIHEIVHILVGKSASFDFSELQPSNDILEEFCDMVTAEFLVPQHSLIRHYNEVGKDFQKLAQIFRVSKIVIIRRLLDLDKISYTDFLDAYNSFRYTSTEKTKQPDAKGGDFYNVAPYRISRSFFNLIYNSIKQGKILYRDAFRLTGLTPKTFDGYVDKYITGIN